MDQSYQSISCYFCFEGLAVNLKVSNSLNGHNDEIYDCVVCCNPNKIKYEVYEAEISGIMVDDDNECPLATAQFTKTQENEGMNSETFGVSIINGKPPKGISTPLEAMWYQETGDWEKAHPLAQSESNPGVSWVHAHPRRVEGDPGNAAYWHRVVDRPICDSSLDGE